MDWLIWYLRNDLKKLGWLGLLATLLFCISIFIYFSLLLPNQKEEELLTQRIANIRNHPERYKQLNPEGVFKEFWASFASQKELGMTVRKVQKIANDKGIDFERVDYKYSRVEGIPLWQYQIGFTSTATYLDIRRFISAVLVFFPNAALRSIEIKRENLVDEELESKVVIDFYFRGAQ